MPIKHPEVLSRADFDQAVVHLRINVSEVAKATNIPRTYLSEFRNGDRKLRPEHQAKLRDFFEGKGVEFESDAAGDDGQDDDRAQSPDPRLRAVKSTRCFFPVADTVPDDVVQGAMDMMDEDEVRLAVLLKEAVARDDGWLGDGSLLKQTQGAMQEAGSLLAEIAVLFLMLRGFRALGVKAAGESPETLRDVLIAAYRPRLEAAGLLELEPEPGPEAATNDGDTNVGGTEDDAPKPFQMPGVRPKAAV